MAYFNRRVFRPRPVFPKRFHPPSSSILPMTLFPPSSDDPIRGRFMHQDFSNKFLIYADGACLSNDSGDAKAGCAFVFQPPGPDSFGPPGKYFRLENEGPMGQPYPQTSNRAELRAVIAALRYLQWTREGFKTLVTATDSKYVVQGATSWVHGWTRNGWTTSNGEPIVDQYLWRCLLEEVEDWQVLGLEIQFWLIPRMLNHEAHRYAEFGAQMDDVPHFVNQKWEEDE